MDNKRYNAVIVGQTGTGKSTLINYLYGQEIAAVGNGIPVTKNGFHPIDFEINGLPVRLFDSWGLEVGKLDQWLLELENEFKNRGVDQPADQWFHSVFYCIQAGGARIQDCDITIIKKFISENYKVSVILTKCDQVSEEVESELKRELQAQIYGISVISVCSEEKKTRSGISKPFGKDDIECLAFSDFFDSLITRLPLRCRSIMDQRLKQWAESKHDSIAADIGFLGSGEADLRSEIEFSAEKLRQEVKNMANDEIKRTLGMYSTFAARLGYPPPEIKHAEKFNKGLFIPYFWLNNWMKMIPIPDFLLAICFLEGSAKERVADYIDRYKLQLGEIIGRQVTAIRDMLILVKSKEVKSVE